MRLTRNFTDDEFKCPCCGRVEINGAFIHQLQTARDIASVPFVINSGYRCGDHNWRVGGSPDSSHKKGLAADIRTQTSSERFAVIDGLIKAGFRRIGVAENYIHVDMDMSKPQNVMWVY
jgi:uncharacterized protein YcbK (DUF882 family)